MSDQSKELTKRQKLMIPVWLALLISLAGMLFTTFMFSATVSGLEGPIVNYDLGKQICLMILWTTLFWVCVLILIVSSLKTALEKKS
jgi:hypothetical protein